MIENLDFDLIWLSNIYIFLILKVFSISNSKYFIPFQDFFLKDWYIVFTLTKSVHTIFDIKLIVCSKI